jgi:transposase
LNSWPALGARALAVEATYRWEWLVESLEDAGHDVHRAHPSRTRAIAAAHVKTDAVEARTLAHLLRADLLPEAYIALRDLRELLRHRAALTAMRAALKNRLHAILAKQGVTRQQPDLFGKGGRQFLAELRLREGPRRRLAGVLSLIDDFGREITAATEEIEQHAKADDRVDVLCQIRGVGRYTAMLIVAEVGDISRFPSLPSVLLGRADPNRSQLGRRSAPRSHLAPRLTALRWALVEAAQKSTTGRDRLREHCERVSCRQGRQGRRRPAHPHPQLRRPARRRDPLPGAPRQREQDREARGLRMRPAAQSKACGPPRARSGCSGEPALLSWASYHHSRRPLD